MERSRGDFIFEGVPWKGSHLAVHFRVISRGSHRGTTGDGPMDGTLRRGTGGGGPMDAVPWSDRLQCVHGGSPGWITKRGPLKGVTWRDSCEGVPGVVNMGVSSGEGRVECLPEWSPGGILWKRTPRGVLGGSVGVRVVGPLENVP
jgi:hypothetical protein